MTNKTYKQRFMVGVRSLSEDAEVERAIDILNKIFEHELAGAVRYTQYSMMIFGHARKPIQASLQSWSDESMLHARQAGELVTAYGGQVSLGIGNLNERHHGDIDMMLREMMDFELDSIDLYYRLMKLAQRYSEPGSAMLEEYSRTMLVAEEQHLSEIEKMLRRCGETYANYAKTESS